MAKKLPPKVAESTSWFTLLRWPDEKLVEVVHFYGTREEAERRAMRGMGEGDVDWQLWPGRANVAVEVEVSV